MARSERRASPLRAGLAGATPPAGQSAQQRDHAEFFNSLVIHPLQPLRNFFSPELSLAG